MKNDKGEVEKVKVGHILLTVTASSNTIDSLEKILTSIKKDVDAGSDLVTEANARGLDVKTSEWVAREDNISAMGFLRALPLLHGRTKTSRTKKVKFPTC